MRAPSATSAPPASTTSPTAEPATATPPAPSPKPARQLYIQGVQEKNCGFFSQFTATPLSPTPLEETFNDLNAMEVYSHSYWLVNFLYNQ